MRKPTMTLQDIERMLEQQDRRLRTAYRELTEERGHPSIAVPDGALEHLVGACEAKPSTTIASNPHRGIRC